MARKCLKIWFRKAKSWFSTFKWRFSFCFHLRPSSSNFWLCLLETQVFTVPCTIMHYAPHHSLLHCTLCYTIPLITLYSNIHYTAPNLFIYQARQSLGWSQQGFWQPSFCRKRNLWRLYFDLRTKVKFLCIATINKKRREETSPFFILSASWYFPFPSWKHWTEALPNSPNQNKDFLNYVFCRNWAVRNPAGTRLDSV